MIDYSDPKAFHSDTPDATHWASRSLQPTLILQRRIRRASIGAQPQEFGSAFWRFSASLQDLRVKEVFDFESEIAKNNGLKPFLFYDRFRPIPNFYTGLSPCSVVAAVKPVSIVASSREYGTVTFVGEDRDVISRGDPFAFILDGVRHYNRSIDTVSLSSSGVVVRTEMRPRVTFSDIDIRIERIRPCAAFALDMQSYSPPTGGKLKNATISGIEWTKASP